MTTPSRPERRTLHATNQVGRQASLRPKSVHVPPPGRRALKLLARAKAAETDLQVVRTAANALVAELCKHPTIASSILPTAFARTCMVLAGDTVTADQLGAVLETLSGEALQVLFSDLAAGPRAVLTIARDPGLLASLAAMQPVAQGVAVGRLVGELSGARRPQSAAELFGATLSL